MKAFSTLLIMALLVGLSAVPLAAQTTLNNTTLAAGATASQTTVSVASASTLAINQLIVVPNYPPEAMLITAISGTTISVMRGSNGTQARAHVVNTRVFTGTANRFKQGPPSPTITTSNFGANTCRTTDFDFLPWVDIVSGIVWTCDKSGGAQIFGVLVGTSTARIVYNSGPPLARTIEPIGVLAQIARAEWFRW